ncbi:acyltransferase family protein [Siphonobacter curvatus]|uniref:Acyltransferase 3 domain-containing protein n=1 Tax=Siphonobacter curvatus TaxID=2094562 RepID=A0A2S7IJ50_9BACT|nr:acyltransferase [Siphonobacter curvatus]PQA56339.1 hypothetical protein C5O19_18545 [Siphonobacter curvatus]
MSKETARQLVLFDVLRGIAILFVFGYHWHQAYFPQVLTATEGPLLSLHHATLSNLYATFSPLAYGNLGVQLFLLISGFLIHYSFLSKQESLNYKQFMLRRFWRIYPTYLLVLLFFAFQNQQLTQYVLHNERGQFSFLTHLLLIHNLFDDADILFGFNGSFWSLALEMQLYALYPLLLALRKRYSLPKVCVGLLVIHLVVITYCLYELRFKFSEITFVGHFWIMWALGALVAENYYYGKRTFRVSAPALVAFSLLFLGTKFFPTFYIFFQYIGSALLFAMLLDYLLEKPLNFTKPIYQVLSLIGVCSYSIYLIHQPLLGNLYSSIDLLGLARHWPWFKFVNVSVAFAFITFLSYSLYLVVEKNSVTLGKRLSTLGKPVRVPKQSKAFEVVEK